MDRVTLRQKAYLGIRSRLLSGELAAGTQLSEPNLAKELEMSRTPVREAIRQMEIEGLLEYAPRFGAMVRIPERRELEEMYAVREALESYAAAEAASSVGPKQIEQLDSILEEMRRLEQGFIQSGQPTMKGAALREFVALDVDFHQAIVRAAGNRYMAKLLDDTRLLIRVFTFTFWEYDRQALRTANDFHQRLFRALKDHDPKAAQQVTVESMQVARTNALKAWDERHSQDGREFTIA